MPFDVSGRARKAAFVLTALTTMGATGAGATPYLVVDADNGQVLIANEATLPWYPASLTKLMTTYVALDAVRAGRLTMDTPIVMSAHAAHEPPSKMGFRPGTEVTLDNALKMLMVKSPNDVAVMIAEGISGSVEAFAGEMNATAERLGLHESHFVNPNGLHDPRHISSARDMAMIARALLRDFPDHADLYGIGALSLGNQVIVNHNGLIGRYPGADGMKTGFTCPAGFNVVASATHWGRRLITVVLGSPSARLRTEEAANLFDRGFAINAGLGPVESLASSGDTPPNMRANVCLHRSAAVVAAAEEEEGGAAETPQATSGGRGGVAVSTVAAISAPVHTELSWQAPHFDPVPVFVGPKPGWTGQALTARADASTTSPLPSDAKAYAPEKSDAAGGASAQSDASAPAVLTNAVRTPPANALHRRPHLHAVRQKRVANVQPQKPPAEPAQQPATIEKTKAKQTMSADTTQKGEKTVGDSAATKGNKVGD